MSRQPSWPTVTASALLWLEQQLSDDGGLMAWASPKPQDFSQHRVHPTIFFSALILEALSQVSGSQTINQSLANFLLHHRSPQWTWNYWMRDSQAARDQPYPDDLDDTVCALSALQHYQPQLIDGTALGNLAQMLIANETAPGGPYETWLIDRQQYPAWHDIDVAVNANIGYYLSLQSIELPGLMDYLDQQLQQPLQSSYYIGELPNIYFLARWYSGKQFACLQFKIAGYLKHYLDLDALMLALLISSACQTGHSQTQLKPLIDRLLHLRVGHHWPAAAFYGEPAIDGRPYFAGSPTLSTALALEALAAYNRLQAQPPAVAKIKTTKTALQRQLASIEQGLPKSDLKLAYHRFTSSVIEHDYDRQIIGMADLTAAALGVSLPTAALTALNLASLNGWVAYTIYDNVLDDQPEPALLGVANFALRQTSAQFSLALPTNSQFLKFVDHTLMVVDAANAWEYKQARASITGEVITCDTLPDYADYHQLAARSWGHVLAASGTFCLAGYKLSHPRQVALRQFFTYFLIARQLNDDAHDWENDLRHGHISVVVSLLLEQSGSFNMRHDLEALRLKFWQQTIDQVVDLIKQHADLARQALQACKFINTTTYENWLLRVEAAADTALAERQATQAFIAAYSGKL